MDSVLIVSFSEILRDARVFRQINTLKNAGYKVHVVGYSSSESHKLNEGVDFINAKRVFSLKYYFWSIRRVINLVEKSNVKPNLVVCNDWKSLPVGIHFKEKYRSKLLYDTHEFAIKEWEESLIFKLLISPFVFRIEKSYIPYADKITTVCHSIAQEYEKIYGKDVYVIRNMPHYVKSNFNPCGIPIKFVHHGGAIASRRLENMIRTMVFLPKKEFELHLILITGTNKNYLDFLINLRNKFSLKNVYFHKPVNQERIVSFLSKFNVGWSYYYPSNINNYYSLPNKFFDFIMAGLCVFAPPLPEQKKIIEQYDVGLISNGFEPEIMAENLIELTPEKINKFKKNALKAAKVLNAEREMARFLKMVKSLLGE